jgi:prepilin-type N-terminal cleavage/methylation domain-containing protein
VVTDPAMSAVTDIATPRAGDSGFTLLELMISIGLTVFVMAAAYLMLDTVSSAANRAQAQSQATEENRHAIEVLTREIRQAVEITQGYGAFDTASYTATACAFYSDVDRDGSPEKVRYYLQSGRLMKVVYQNLTTLAPFTFSATPDTGYPKGVCSIVSNTDIFRYVDGQDPPVDVPATRSRDAATVILHIVDNATSGDQDGQSDISTWVEIRTINSVIE